MVVSARGPGLLIALAFAAAASHLLGADGRVRSVAPHEVRWKVLTFHASRLGISTTADLVLETVPAASASRMLTAPARGQALVPQEATTAILTLGHSFLGQTTTTRVWFDPGTGRALQRLHIEAGRRVRRKTFRYTREGVAYLRRSPAEGEESLPPEQWLHSGSDFYPFPPAAAGAPVIEPATLFYLASASGLTDPGQSLRLHAFTRKRVDGVVLEVTRRRRLPVCYTEVSTSAQSQVTGHADALCLNLRAEPLDGATGDTLELLGLEGDLELCLDVHTRIPLQLTGRFKLIGEVEARLARVVLRDVEGLRPTPVRREDGGCGSRVGTRSHQ